MRFQQSDQFGQVFTFIFRFRLIIHKQTELRRTLTSLESINLLYVTSQMCYNIERVVEQTMCMQSTFDAADDLHWE